MERDPRKDPRPGDVTKFKDDVMLVVRREGDNVWWAYSGQRSDVLAYTTVDIWKQESVNEEVLHVAGA